MKRTSAAPARFCRTSRRHVATPLDLKGQDLDMLESDNAAVSLVKERVAAMLAERTRVYGDTPSDYWSDFCEYFSYVGGMSNESFERLRLHTYHITGDTYLPYYVRDYADERAVRAQWQEAIRAVPEELIISEPSDGYGFEFGEHLVNLDICRYQRVLKTLNSFGILRRLRSARAHQAILEVGPGYGGLAHHLSSALSRTPGQRTTFILVDLPETLLFSASYITLHNPAKSIYIYDAENPPTFDQAFFEKYDFALLPNYRLGDLNSMQFDLVLNVASLQEMRMQQVADYLDFVLRTCRGHFYSWNLDSHPRNHELGGTGDGLSSMLNGKFRVTEVPSDLSRKEALRRAADSRLRSLAGAIGLVHRKPSTPAYKEYICVAKSTIRSPAGDGHAATPNQMPPCD